MTHGDGFPSACLEDHVAAERLSRRRGHGKSMGNAPGGKLSEILVR